MGVLNEKMCKNVQNEISQDRFFFVFSDFFKKSVLKHNAVNPKIMIFNCYHKKIYYIISVIHCLEINPFSQINEFKCSYTYFSK